MLEIALGLVVVVLALLYYYLTSTFSHWKDKGVKFTKGVPGLGSMAGIFTQREHMSDFFTRIYWQFPDEPFSGYFQSRTPALLIRDPELVKAVMVKDFSHFVDHGFEVHEDIDPLQAKNLFNMAGQPWKEMRSKLTPTFTSGRMKAMFPLVQECALEFETYLGTVADSGEDLNIKDVLARYTTDVISSCAFGVKRNSINNPEDHFRVMGRQMLRVDTVQGFKNGMIFFAPQIARILRFRFFDSVVTDFFRNLVHDVIAMRQKTGNTRKDFMQLLIELKEKGRLSPEEGEKAEHMNGSTDHANSKLTDDDISAQAMVFFLAGFETSSTALTFALYEMARQPELQREARRQIEEVLQRHDGKMSYQAMLEMTYLDWILQESLRLYPPVSQMNRVCTKNYVIPGTKVTVEEGTLLAIPIFAMQRDAKFFPDPERFDPERFSDENQNQKTQYVNMPFGEGPRQCIGLRFARMQSKLGLVSLLRQFEFEPCARTKYPLTFDPRQFILSAREDIFLKAKRVQN